MAMNNKVGQKRKYSIFQNAKGEIMIMVESLQSGPENPWLFYDGGQTALLYRSPDSAIAVKDIEEGARGIIKAVSEVLIVEVNDEDVEREYIAPVRLVKSVEGLYSEA
jgi:hypothetical protein